MSKYVKEEKVETPTNEIKKEEIKEVAHEQKHKRTFRSQPNKH